MYAGVMTTDTKTNRLDPEIIRLQYRWSDDGISWSPWYDIPNLECRVYWTNFAQVRGICADGSTHMSKIGF
jgi:hypothetical protein